MKMDGFRTSERKGTRGWREGEQREEAECKKSSRVK